MSAGKSARLFLADGTPGGLLTAEIMNWTGHVVAAPRSDLAALLKRPEASRTGIYILLGDDPDSLGGQAAYIGEGDDVSKRLYQHARPEGQNGKDFWDRAIVLTSKDANLTKAHARYLESRFITLAMRASRARLTNGTAPAPIVLPEADVSDMEYFIEQAKIVLPILGVNIFRSPRTSAASASASSGGGRTDSPLFEMTMKKSGISATAQEVDGEFTVLEGSQARSAWIGAAGHNYVGLRTKLENDGTLVSSPDSATTVFTRDHAFSSPSAAAAVVAGRNANGRLEWKVQGTQTTYGEWESEGLEEAMSEGGRS
ncbi:MULTISPECIES: GIY-YIG nuclease family protein [unclassified Gordonia (in: high G+C Gram-positive bacteria)]|uniref:GIY-YIG nuclease family protein n=1 Tax=unclassified Gordonia (in: high G+C Gram-positive bacteria) TaxID=2657482 RepID=UPI0010F6015F|nr:MULTISPECIES: GIY-YIG nuclease family protein [unclassified Gordonia (in: high G+C Gram-positive bacteria)]